MTRWIVIAVLLAAAWFQFAPAPSVTPLLPSATQGGGDVLAHAYEQRRSNLQVQGEGVVERILPDDNDGSRHQRFILRLHHGQTVLVAHNIDLAPRVENLGKGDIVGFYGEYEWNAKGGVIHWTHRDPAGRHPHGWLKHQDRTYQ
jgi:hypothetical protein